jgi:rhodanese-related sulfurtransferase
MTFQIISPKILKRHLLAGDILLLDLRSRQDYEEEHIPQALWMDWERATADVPLLWETYLKEHGCPPAWIALYCDSGHISLLTARDLATRGYPAMSLNGGYRQWKAEPDNNP